MTRPSLILLFAILTSAAAISHADELSTQNKKELTVFGLRAMGMKADVRDVKNLLSRPEIEKMVQAGLNLQGRLCSKITNIRPPWNKEVKGIYRVTCITYTGRRETQHYFLDALQGISYDIHEYLSHLNIPQ
jgi:hypothetical protein